MEGSGQRSQPRRQPTTPARAMLARGGFVVSSVAALLLSLLARPMGATAAAAAVDGREAAPAAADGMCGG